MKRKIIKSTDERQSGFLPEPDGDGEPGTFEVSLVVKTKAVLTGQVSSLTVCRGTAPGERIEEILSQALRSEYFLRCLRAVVGDPLNAA